MTRIIRSIGSAIVVSAALLVSTQSFAAPDTEKPEYSASGDKPAPDSSAPISTEQLGSEYQNLSPEARAALADQIKAKGADGLSNMSESDARAAFAKLPPDVRAQIQAKWDALTDEQRIALKKMGPAAIKKIAASQMKEAVKDSVTPVIKPVEQAVDKAESVMQRGRDYVQGVIAKFKGQPEPAQP